jgi:GNAT superfamily N-acetyltransferase
MSINFSINTILFNSPEYEKMVDLRRKVLRIPLGLDFSNEDLNKDIHSYLFGCFNDKKEIIGCCTVDNCPDNISFKLRQMAVDPLYQSKGIGRALINFVEIFAKGKKINRINLHARKNAVPFYQKSGYNVYDDEFTEVNIPHLKMEKIIIMD